MTLPSPLFTSSVPKPQLPPPIVTKQANNRHIQYVAYCKFCSEGFPNENELAQHRRSHEKCPFDDCKFNASGKVVAAHVQRVHMKTNSLVKVQDLTTPEQIEKWREERRKRYPTTANVQLRQQAQEQRMERGEKLQNRQQRFGDSQQKNHIKNFDKRQGNKNKHKNQHHNRHPDARNKSNDAEKPSDSSETKIVRQFVQKLKDNMKAPAPAPMQDSSDEDTVSTPRFKGTSQMKDYHKVETIVKEHAALSILGMYGSESETEDDSASQTVVEMTNTEPIEAVVSENVLTETATNAVADEKEHIEDDDNEAPDEQPISHNATNEPQPDKAPEKFPRKRKHESNQHGRVNKVKPRTGLDYSKLRTKPSVNPFLEKLLQDDIRHERNVLLQCVNFVVRNNFFDLIPKAPTSAEGQESSVMQEPFSKVATESNEDVEDIKME